MTQGIRIEIDEGLSMVELPEAGDHLGFINLPKNSQFIVDDSENYFAIEMRHGKSSLVLMLERDQYESLIYELGFGPTSNRGTYGRLQKLIDENGCLRVQTRAKQLYELDKEAGGSNHRSHNFKKWFAGEKALPGEWTRYYKDYMPGHEHGHPATESCRTSPPSLR